MKNEIKQLQNYMKEQNLDAFLVETADDHQSEYVGDYYKFRAFLSGFTGSAGTLLVTNDAAYLWTDGRYFIQAENQLANTGITLMKMNQKGVLTLMEMLASLGKDFSLGLDMRMVSSEFVTDFKKQFPLAQLVNKQDAADKIWQNRPSRSCNPVWHYDEAYCGKSYLEKADEVRQEMANKQVAGMLFASLDDISWLLNIRGNDVACNPVALSFVLMTMTRTTVYLQTEALTSEINDYFNDLEITVRPYDAIYDDLQLYDDGMIWYDPKKTNGALVACLADTIGRYEAQLPTTLLKSIKNEVEIENTKKAHIMDGLAVTKWMYWLKHTIKQRELTEIEASDYLEAMRKENPSFIDLSFATICAYNANAAMMHYQATPEKHATIKAEGMLLVDSGGQYYEGTTDITRTIILGPTPDIYKEHFTKALRSLLRLQTATFLEGCTGLNLDILARGPLWDEYLDYQCGTGHGVGHLLNVHEGPNGFRWRVLANRNEMAVLQPGMITTDEPGVYIENSHGVRHENELLCVFKEENFYGRFLAFEPITYAPIDLDGVVVSLLEPKEKEALNAYHQMVYETLSPYLEGDIKAWLKTYTRAI